MATTALKKAYNPLILRCSRLMEAFAKSDEERDFFLDKQEGFIVFVDLDKDQEDLDSLAKEVERNPKRYIMVPKMTFYEAKKIMENFVHEKVYDIDTKEKLMDIIQSKDARENFLEFLYDHPAELDKWQLFYQERGRIGIIQWLRDHDLKFVFEEDLDLPANIVEHLKQGLFQARVSKELTAARKTLEAKAKTYYSNEALNPRPKRGRPPKQSNKPEIEPQVTMDIYTTVPKVVRPFLFVPDLAATSAATFSSRYENEEALLASMRNSSHNGNDATLASLNSKLASLRSLSRQWLNEDEVPASKQWPELSAPPPEKTAQPAKRAASAAKPAVEKKKPPAKKAAAAKSTPTTKKTPAKRTLTRTDSATKKTPAKKTPAKKTPAKKAPAKKTPAKRTLKRTGPAAKKAAPAKKAPAKKAPPKRKPLQRLRTTKTKKKS